MRLQRETIHMAAAIMWAHRSQCSSGIKVGAVITTPDLKRVLSVGYNGPAAGLPDDYCAQQVALGKTAGVSRCTCLHAEDNAIANVDSTIPNKTLFVTMQPCEICAQRIKNAGITLVWYWKQYRNDAGLVLLRRLGVKVGVLSCSVLDDVNRTMRQWQSPTPSGM
jgi:deoxycytidylate deaminase